MIPKVAAAGQVVKDRQTARNLPDAEQAAKKVSSEELLDKIKELSQDGHYSVQFEMNKDVNSLVIRVVDRDSGELIRQFPSEELLRSAKVLKDLRGLMVNTES